MNNKEIIEKCKQLFGITTVVRQIGRYSNRVYIVTELIINEESHGLNLYIFDETNKVKKAQRLQIALSDILPPCEICDQQIEDKSYFCTDHKPEKFSENSIREQGGRFIYL